MLRKLFFSTVLIIFWGMVNSMPASCAEFFMAPSGSNINLKVGGSAAVDIFMNTTGENIAAADVIVKYDSAIMEAVNIDTTVSDMVFDLGGGTTSVAANNIDNAAGRAHFVTGAPAPNFVNGPAVRICRINFKILCAADSTNKNPPAAVSLDFTATDGNPDCKAIIAGAEGADVLNKTSAANIYFSVKSADTNADGIINTLDLLRVRNLMGVSDTNPNYDLAADVNADGIINTLDLLKVRNLMGT